MAKKFVLTGIILKEASLSNKVDSKILELLSQANWNDIVPRLTRYALSKLSILSGSPLEGVPIEEIAHDIVNEAIIKVMNGHRKWDPHKGSLLNYLISVIKSDISHLYASDRYKSTFRFPEIHDNSESKPVESEELLEKAKIKKAHSLDKDAASINPDIPQSPEEALIEKEVYDQLLKAVEGDNELEGIVLCMLDGHENPRAIAKVLGIDKKDVYNAKKRLQKIYSSLLRQRG